MTIAYVNSATQNVTVYNRSGGNTTINIYTVNRTLETRIKVGILYSIYYPKYVNLINSIDHLSYKFTILEQNITTRFKDDYYGYTNLLSTIKINRITNIANESNKTSGSVAKQENEFYSFEVTSTTDYSSSNRTYDYYELSVTSTSNYSYFDIYINKVTTEIEQVKNEYRRSGSCAWYYCYNTTLKNNNFKTIYTFNSNIRKRYENLTNDGYRDETLEINSTVIQKDSTQTAPKCTITSLTASADSNYSIQFTKYSTYKKYQNQCSASSTTGSLRYIRINDTTNITLVKQTPTVTQSSSSTSTSTQLLSNTTTAVNSSTTSTTPTTSTTSTSQPETTTDLLEYEFPTVVYDILPTTPIITPPHIAEENIDDNNT